MSLQMPVTNPWPRGHPWVGKGCSPTSPESESKHLKMTSRSIECTREMQVKARALGTQARGAGQELASHTREIKGMAPRP